MSRRRSRSSSSSRTAVTGLRYLAGTGRRSTVVSGRGGSRCVAARVLKCWPGGGADDGAGNLLSGQPGLAARQGSCTGWPGRWQVGRRAGIRGRWRGMGRRCRCLLCPRRCNKLWRRSSLLVKQGQGKEWRDGNCERLRAGHEMTVAAAVDKYHDHVHDSGLSARTWQAYGVTFRQFCDEFGGLAVGELDPDAVAEWFTGRWGGGSEQGWNANRAALRSAFAWWGEQPDNPFGADPFCRIGRRKLKPDRSRALDRAVVERLVTSQRVPLRERCLWSLLYETCGPVRGGAAVGCAGPGPGQSPGRCDP